MLSNRIEERKKITRSIRGEIRNHYYGPFPAFTLRPIDGAPETQPSRPAIIRIGKTCTLLEELCGSQSTPAVYRT